MALLFLEGWEGLVPRHYTTYDQCQTIARDYIRRRYPLQIPREPDGWSLALDNTGKGRALHWGQSTFSNSQHLAVHPKEIPNANTFYVGMRIKFPDSTTGFNPLLWNGKYTPFGVHGYLNYYNNGDLRVYRNATVIGTVAGVITPGAWHYIEIGVQIGNTGSYTLKVDGSTVLTNPSVDNDDNMGPTTTFRFQGPTGASNNAAYLLDDIYIADSTGSIVNTFQGPIKIHGYRPISSAGTGWSASAGDDLAKVVSNSPWDLDSYVLSTNTAANDVLFTYDDHHTGNIIGVAQKVLLRNTKPYAVQYLLTAKSGATSEQLTFPHVDPDDAVVAQQVLEVDPNSSAAWTQGGLNSASFGVEVG